MAKFRTTTLRTCVRDVGLIAALLALVVSSCIPGPSAGDTGTAGAAPPAERHAGAAGRLAAALEDRAAEQDRIAAAQRYRVDAGGGVRVHTVSLADPVPPGDFVDAVAMAGLSVQTVHVWVQSPGLVEIGTGTVESATGVPAADDPAFVEYLDRPGGHGADRTAFGDHLVGDHQLGVFGLVCSCALPQIDQFEAHLGAAAVRAVEMHGHVTRMPIWPRDPVRDAIIESGGTYGR